MVPLFGEPFFRDDLPGFQTAASVWTEARIVDPEDRSLLRSVRRVDWRRTVAYARRNAGEVVFEVFEEMP